MYRRVWCDLVDYYLDYGQDKVYRVTKASDDAFVIDAIDAIPEVEITSGIAKVLKSSALLLVSDTARVSADYRYIYIRKEEKRIKTKESHSIK